MRTAGAGTGRVAGSPAQDRGGRVSESPQGEAGAYDPDEDPDTDPDMIDPMQANRPDDDASGEDAPG